MAEDYEIRKELIGTLYRLIDEEFRVDTEIIGVVHSLATLEEILRQKFPGYEITKNINSKTYTISNADFVKTVVGEDIYSFSIE